VREFGVELAFCAALEAATGSVVARQLGAGVAEPGGRIADVVAVVPGPGFDDRAAITAETIPHPAIESDVGVGRAARPERAIDARPERARAVAGRAVEVGFFERDGPDAVRRACRYPDDWVGGLRGFEIKPDLDRPGALAEQLRTDASLGLFDRTVLVTRSHVTGAHLHRLPDPVGVWRFDPAGVLGDGVAGDDDSPPGVTVVREAAPLPVDEPGIEPLERRGGEREIAVVDPGAKARRRRAIAERAYGSGWRTFDWPDCGACRPTDAATATLPDCAWKGRLVNPARECGPDCPGHEPDGGPSVDTAAERAAASPWMRDPEGRTRRQTGLDAFE
jgi:hypothetical protein